MLVKTTLSLLLIGMVWAAPLGMAVAETVATSAAIKIVRVELVSQPMVYVTANVSMSEIPAFMDAGFASLGQFLGTTGVTALGPPMALYHDWSGDKTAVDLGFPVSVDDAKKATGAVLGGMTPGGHALKLTHVGPYAAVPAAYAALDTAMKDAAIPVSSLMWEVYLNEPGVTPEAELITEIYTAVSAADAAKFPAQ